MTLVSGLKDEELDLWVAKADNCILRRVDHDIKRSEGSWLPDVHQHGWIVIKLQGGNEIVLGAIPESSTFSSFLMNTYSPSTDWSQGGPIIEREGIDPDPMIGDDGKPEYWACFLGNSTSHGSTLLIAAMRCYVASRFGEEV